MKCKLFVFRHSETFDNKKAVFSGWRESKLTEKGIIQARKISRQLKEKKIQYAFASHLSRSIHTMNIVLEFHPNAQIYKDDRLIERCWGHLQGKSKNKMRIENPKYFKNLRKCYSLVPPSGESLEMVDRRVVHFIDTLTDWLRFRPANVAISCHNNSIRPFRRIFEKSTVQTGLQTSPQDRAMIYDLEVDQIIKSYKSNNLKNPNWEVVLVPKKIRYADDPRNPLRKYYNLI